MPNEVIVRPAFVSEQKQLEALKGRSAEDNWELTDDIDSLLAVTSEEFRESLESRISSGDLRALHSYGRVTDLPSAVAQGAIEHLSSSVAEQIEQAGKGTYSIRVDIRSSMVRT